MDAASLDALRIALDPTSQGLIAIALFLIMFSVALGLTVSDFKAVLTEPLLYGGGVAAQTLGLPLLTLGLVFIMQPPASIALGMIVIAACPGGNVSNMMTYFGRGDTALSVSLTATSSVIAALVTPTSILLWSSLYPPTAALLSSINFDALSFVAQTTALLAVPLSLGMALARWRPTLAARLQKPGAAIGAGALGIVVVTGTWDIFPLIISAWALIGPPVFVHNAAAFALGALVGRALSAPVAARRA
ncbi:MAG: bile acid:sodium symporter, partial [Pseudomonadota bacterium]